MGDLRFSTGRDRLDLDLIHRFLSTEAPWSLGISRDVVQRAIAGSLCFGGYVGEAQVAFGRVITDGATFAYLADVFVLRAYRGRGYGRQLLDTIMAYPTLQGLRRFMLATADAHALYAKFGFAAPARPERLMEILDFDLYTRAAQA